MILAAHTFFTFAMAVLGFFLFDHRGPGYFRREIAAIYYRKPEDVLISAFLLVVLSIVCVGVARAITPAHWRASMKVYYHGTRALISAGFVLAFAYFASYFLLVTSAV